jgi:carbamoyl-phosphate synthase large subunit
MPPWRNFLEQLPAHKPVNLLFTSVGRRVELLRAFRRAYQALELEGRIVAADVDPLAPALQLADRPYLVPRLTESGYIPTLVEICRREQISLILPLIDPDIPVLAKNRAAIEATGARPAVVSPEAAATTADKYLTTQFFRELGLSTPRSWLPGQLNPAQAEYPLFIKPRRGSAARHTFKVRDERELVFFLEYVPDPIIQEYLPGPEITNDVVCGLDGEILAVVSRQRIEVRWGEVAKGMTIYHPTITDGCAKIARALPAPGPITVQCMLKNDVPHFTEINARLGGGAPLGIAAGVDYPDWLLARVAGLPVEIPPLGHYQTGLYMTRADDSFFLTEADYEQVASHRL